MGVFRYIEKVHSGDFFSQHLCTFGCCPFGSWLSIHISSQDLSFIDFADTCLFYHRRLKVNIGKSEIDQKGDYGAIFSQPPYTSGTCFFGSEASIHIISQGLSFVDPADTCLFYLGVVKVDI